MTEETAAMPASLSDVRDVVTVRLPADSAYLSVLRTATAGLAARLDFNLDEIEDLRIAIDEACAMLLAQAVPGTDLTCEFELTDDAMSIGVSVLTVDGRQPSRDTFAWTVLSSLAGSAYFPDCRGAILFIEEINEYLYRVERMLSTLRLSGALDAVAGVVIGQFTKCEPGDGYGSLTLEEILNDYFLPLNVPVYRGAMFGHVKLKLTLPVGAPAELDADAGTIRLLEPATA